MAAVIYFFGGQAQSMLKNLIGGVTKGVGGGAVSVDDYDDMMGPTPVFTDEDFYSGTGGADQSAWDMDAVSKRSYLSQKYGLGEHAVNRITLL